MNDATEEGFDPEAAGNTVLPAVLVVGLGRFELPTFGPPDRCTPNR